MTHRIAQLGLAIVAALLHGSMAQATPVLLYSYTSPTYDPTTQGWTASANGGTYSNNTTDQTVNVNSPANQDQYFLAHSGPTSVTDPSGWTATAIVRPNSLSFTTNVEGISLSIDTGPGHAFWNIDLVAASDSTAGVWTQGASGPVQLTTISDISSVFHTYQLINADGNPDTAPQLYVDGVATGQFAQNDGGSFLGSPAVIWGNLTSLDSSNSDWQLVSLEVGQHPVAESISVPEPTSLLLAALGLIGFVASIRRERAGQQSGQTARV